ncbi:MAG: C40 family peptidase [Gammaproteobacteria bacterium]|nr:C40 family peptidase [Gammaproteobacteria bacterium]
MNKEISIKTYCAVLLTAILISCASNPRDYETRANRAKPYDMDKANAIVSMAKRMIGMPYRYGGSNPLEGFDCSGLVLFTHSQVSSGIPRVSKAQYAQSKTIALQDIQPGDLLFYRTASTPSHVTIYIGGRKFIHAPSSGKEVMIGSMDNPYFKTRLVKAGRLY